MIRCVVKIIVEVGGEIENAICYTGRWTPFYGG